MSAFLSRRDFIQGMTAAGLATIAAGDPKQSFAAEPVQHPKPTADTCILLWMAGGMGAPDTCDPKRYKPFEVGVKVDKIVSTFPAIDTVVDNIKITEGLENIARVMDRATLIRSHVLPDLGNILHSRHQYHWHTGYVPPQTVAAPHIGSWMARVLGPRNPAHPGFHRHRPAAGRRRREGRAEGVHTAGFFGTEYGPFLAVSRTQAAIAVRPPKGMTPERFAEPTGNYSELVQAQPGRRAGQRLSAESRCSARWRTPIGCLTQHGAQGLRSDAGAEGELRQIQHGPFWAGLPAGPAADRGRGAGSSR